LETECADDQVQPDSACTPVEPAVMVCCVLKSGEAEYISTGDCTAQGGTPTTADALCQACCEYAGSGVVESAPAAFCIAAGGTIVDDAQCEEPAVSVCCSVDGEPDYIPSAQCTEQSGTVVELSECQVCCKNPFGNGPEFVFEEDCQVGQTQPDSVCTSTVPPKG
jgi:hypothetical protein